MAVLQADYKPRQITDEEIVRRVVAGEKELFEILMRRYNQTVYRIVRSYLKDQAEVEDVMQNSYLKAFDRLYQFQGNSSFSTWLIRISINEALSGLKQINRSKRVFMHDDQTHASSLTQIADRMNPEKAIIRKEAKQLLERAIDKLPEKYRIIYMLKEVEGLTNTQIQDALDISESNIKVRLHRAKRLLQESLFELTAGGEVFEFGNSRCDALVSAVMSRI